MKYIYILCLVSFGLLLNGCTGVKSTVGGLDNESFLSFYTSNSAIENIDVNLQQKGSNTTFSAKVNKMRRNSTNFQKRPNGQVYSINPGSFEIRVTHNKKIIYSKKIFISNQETKIIKL
tara:strand:- start:1117 stop:1473 length:357 start_codon:yes stop_codon:yes gene_type:complete